MKAGTYHGLFPFSPIVDRPPLKWPNGAHVAVWVVPNIEHYELEVAGRQVDVRNLSHREYGNRVGIWRLMDALTEYGIRGTVALNSAGVSVLPAHPGAFARARLGIDGAWSHQLAVPL